MTDNQTMALLATTYFGPVQWYQKLNRYDEVQVERYDTFRKQTFRNRCVIATTNGLQALTVPVERPDDGLHATVLKDLRISDHGNWRHLHWHALMTAYNESPFFEYYADDLHPFFERKWEFLYDFNTEICEKLCELIDIRPNVTPTNEYHAHCTIDNMHDFRDVIDPKHPLSDDGFAPKRYYQVYERRFGFQANLSILDLLFNMGPESVFYL